MFFPGAQCVSVIADMAHPGSRPTYQVPLILSGAGLTGPRGTWRWPFAGPSVRKADEELRGGFYCEEWEIASGPDSAGSALFEYLNQLDFKIE